MNDEYQRTKQQSKILAQRMRMGTGVNSLLTSQNPTHYIDSFQRFRKDYASYDKAKRDQQNFKRQIDLQRKRIEYLERQNNRWQKFENQYQKIHDRQSFNQQLQRIGLKRTANSNGLAYNPINLQYQKNPEGQKLKLKDQDQKIRGFVRAHNMDFKGNSKFNPLNGTYRVGIEKIVPQDLTYRYQEKLYQHYDNMRLKVPSSAMNTRNTSPKISYK